MIFHFILGRKHGSRTAYPIAAAFDDAGLLALQARYVDLTSGTNARTFADSHADMLFATVDGDQLSVRHSHSFADPAIAIAADKRAALDEALRLRSEIDAANKAAEVAEMRALSAEIALDGMSDEQRQLLAEHDARVAAEAAKHAQRATANLSAVQERADDQNAAIAAQRITAGTSAAAATSALESTIIAPIAPVETPRTTPAPEEIVAPVEPVTPPTEPIAIAPIVVDEPPIDGPQLPPPNVAAETAPIDSAAEAAEPQGPQLTPPAKSNGKRGR